MTLPGHQMMDALDDVRQLFRELHALLADIAQRLDRQGWSRASASTKGSNQLSTGYDAPDAWMPKHLFRWFHHPANHPGVYLAFVVQLERIDGHPAEPWVIGAAYTYDDDPWGPGAHPIADREALAHAAGLHVEEEDEVADGHVLVRRFDGGVRHSLAVPLLSITGSEDLWARVVAPILAAATR